MAEDDALDFLPLFPDEDEDAILARLRAWTNEGLDPAVDADEWVDTREGSFWHISVMPTVRELARLYDLAGTEVPASGFPLWAWADYLDDHAEVQNIERLTATPAIGEVTFETDPATDIAAGVRVGVALASPDDDAPEFEVTAGGTTDGAGLVTLPIRAVETGSAGNVGAGAITEVLTPLGDVTVTNAEATGAGSDPESDEDLRERVLAAFEGPGAGNKRYYERIGREWAGVGRAYVIPLWAGPGTVKVIVTDAAGGPLPTAVVDALQADLDPVAVGGEGEGTAAVGAVVTVETATVLVVDVAATIELDDGFSLDGGGGTRGVRGPIEDALGRYLTSVPPGGEVVVRQVEGQIVTVAGVHDIADVAVGGGSVNLLVPDSPPQVPVLGLLTLTVGIVP